MTCPRDACGRAESVGAYGGAVDDARAASDVPFGDTRVRDGGA
jgi:hypothetical protein